MLKLHWRKKKYRKVFNNRHRSPPVNGSDYVAVGHFVVRRLPVIDTRRLVLLVVRAHELWQTVLVVVEIVPLPVCPNFPNVYFCDDALPPLVYSRLAQLQLLFYNP